MWKRLAKDSNSVVVTRVDLGQADDHLADFVDPENFFRIFFDGRLDRFRERQHEVEENCPFLGFGQKRKVDFVGQGRILFSGDRLKIVIKE